jgi:uncharacterized protein
MNGSTHRPIWHHPGRLLIIAGAGLGLARELPAEIIGSDDFDGTGQFLSRGIAPEPPGGIFGGNATDVFGIVDRTVNAHFADDTLMHAASRGLIPSTKTDRFFGIEDLDNGINPSGEGAVTWTFDIDGYTDLRLSVDLAARGKFESSDVFGFTVQIGGGAETPVFSINPDLSATYTYTFENGATETLDNPLVLNNTIIGNGFQTFNAPIAGDGNQLLVRFEATQNGDGELFALDNLTLEGTPIPTPVPGAVILLLSGVGILGAFRRPSCARPAGRRGDS